MRAVQEADKQGKDGTVMPAITVDSATLHALCIDCLGICLNCGSGTDPVEHNAVGKLCDACGQMALAGIFEAMRQGAIVVGERVMV